MSKVLDLPCAIDRRAVVAIVKGSIILPEAVPSKGASRQVKQLDQTVSKQKHEGRDRRRAFQ